MTAGEIIAFVTAELEGTLVVVASEENGAPHMQREPWLLTADVSA